ncbi:MAG: carboxypeptidase-like regulatory domain-containing protein [Ignavibacteria bacterium]|nr:carboxypeptidase-like regulatory domain-containing protein [Ignavibacteria bacterium]
MKQLRQFFLLTLVFFSPAFTKSFPQANSIEIAGNVIDGETGIPIENVAVFLSFTTFHAKTNSSGEFKLTDVIPGTYAIICIADSFQTVTQRIDVTGVVNLRANFILKKQQSTLKNKIVQMVSFIEPYKFVEKFKKEFFGESIRTFKCDILNPDDIAFTHNGVQLFAKSAKPIIVLNKSLGYKLTVYLKEFEWEWFKDYGIFSFDIFFENMVASDSTEALRFLANRKEAYNGSFRHFLRACASRKVSSEGFTVFNADYVPTELGEYEDFKDQIESQRPWQTAGLIESIMKKNGENEFLFETDAYLEVVYSENCEEPNYALYKERIFGTNETYEFQDSWVKFPAGKYYFNNRGIGMENDTFQKHLFGYWSWKRVSDLLPHNYEPNN